MNRIDRRIIMCMLLIAALAIVWNLLGGPLIHRSSAVSIRFRSRCKSLWHTIQRRDIDRLLKRARIGIMRALNRHVERVFNPDRKDHHWGRRKLARSMTKAVGC
jgi:hypothetical protein